MIRGRLRETYPRSGPVFGYQVEELDGTVRVTQEDGDTELIIHDPGTPEGWSRTPDGNSHYFASSWVGSALHLWLDGNLFIFERSERTQRNTSHQVPVGGDVLAPVPGTVVQVLVGVGARVEAGDRLVTLESMKMELVIDAPRRGVVRRISVAEGDLVDQGMRLIELEDPDQDDRP